MSFSTIRADITKLEVDAIVNPTDPYYSGSGGVDLAVHNAAGIGLEWECSKLDRLKVGGATITKGYNLPCKYVIHTVGPRWNGGSSNEEEKLKLCYRNALHIAHAHNCKSVAIPVISSGTFRFPKDLALDIAISETRSFVNMYDMDIILVVYDDESFVISKELLDDVKDYINQNYNKNCAYHSERVQSAYIPSRNYASDKQIEETVDVLKDEFCNKEETFSRHLLRLIDERGLTDAETYKRAFVDRRLFSKIRSNENYTPSKQTIIYLAFALQLDIIGTETLLSKAGHALSDAIKYDLVARYFIEKRIYDLSAFEKVLAEFDLI